MAKGFNELWNDVAQWLPEFWQLSVTVDGNKGGYSVELLNAEGDSVEFPSNQESLEESVSDAVNYAMLTELGVPI